jgi:hypothetical protein
MDGDTFMRTDCKADKWLIIELPQVIRPDMLRVSPSSTVVLAHEQEDKADICKQSSAHHHLLTCRTLEYVIHRALA